MENYFSDMCMNQILKYTFIGIYTSNKNIYNLLKFSPISWCTSYGTNLFIHTYSYLFIQVIDYN